MTGDCRHCSHAIGYHHDGTADESFCTVNDCNCPGYQDDDPVEAQEGQ